MEQTPHQFVSLARNQMHSCYKSRPILKIVVSVLFVILVNSVSAQEPQNTYTIHKIDAPMVINADWQKPVWQKIEPLELTHFMGDKPRHFPEVKAKVAYDDENIYLIWQVKDQYVRAVADKHQGPVFQDSCVEFFFIPDNLGGTEYFNLEMNCGGTMLFHHQDYNQPERVNITEEDIASMKVAHTLPRLIPEEIQEKTTWYLEYSIPFKILNNYYSSETPEPGAVWRANFYKCADKTSHPHWLTWSEVEHPTPRFHLPQFFGKLVFE